jgi:hypothetical protein
VPAQSCWVGCSKRLNPATRQTGKPATDAAPTPGPPPAHESPASARTIPAVLPPSV